MLKNINPGPGAHDLPQLNPGYQKSILGGPIETKMLTDNGNPGPGNYDLKSLDKIPNFKISKPSPKSKEYKLW